MKRLMVFLIGMFLSLNSFAKTAEQDNCKVRKKFKECTSSKVYEGEEYLGCNVSEKGELQFYSHLDMSEDQCEHVCDTKRKWFSLILIPNLEVFL